MRVIHSRNFSRLTAAVAMATALVSSQLRADVLDEVPSNALAVVEVKNLHSLSEKVAKTTQAWGLDELQPKLKDPLGTALEKAHLTKGVNTGGDAALIIFAPNKSTHVEPEPAALIPVSDYDEFLGNFEKVDNVNAGDGVTVVKSPEEQGTNLFIVHRGTYALISNRELKHLDKVGIKLTGVAAKELSSKDAVFFFNLPVVRDLTLPEIKKHREEWVKEVNKAIDNEPKIKAFEPVINVALNEAFDGVETGLSDADGLIFGLQIGDEGLLGSAVLEFKEGSTCASYVAMNKTSDIPPLAGLPNVKYFLFGGASADSKAMAPLADKIFDPLIKELHETHDESKIGEQFAAVLETAKTIGTASTHNAVGWVAPTKPLGQDSIFAQIQVSNGDAQALADGQKKMMDEANGLMSLIPNGAKVKIDRGGAKTVDGSELQTYSTKFDVDENDPRGVQAQQMFSMLYGPNGLNGVSGVLNEKTFLIAQGASDEVLEKTVKSAKEGKDELSDLPNVKMVIGHLPKESSVLYFVALDNIVSTAVKYAEGFGLPVKIKLPHDLPPIGFSAGTEGSAVRMDVFIPSQTVQSLIASGIDAYTQMQQGNKGGGL